MSDIRNELLPKGRSLYSPREIIRSTLVFLVVLGLVAVLNLLIHEFGHCITIDRVGGECEGVYVYPGVKIWPLSEWADEYPGTWSNYVGLALYARPAPTEYMDGLVSLMGSGSTAIASFLALVGLYIFRPRGGVRTLLLAQSVMFIDLLTYTILPRWFGLPHFFFIGGTDPEPLEGAIQMGIPESTFIAAVLIFSLLMSVGSLRYARRKN